MSRLSILLPTLNEEENITKTICEIKATVPQAEIVVIDGLSTDRTVELAKGLGARLIYEKKRGKAHAIKRAFEEVDSDYVLMLDADQTYPINDIPRFIDLLKDHDVVIGSRFKGSMEAGAMSPVNAFGNWALTMAAGLLFFRPLSDLCTGMWGFNILAYKSMELRGGGFEIESTLFAQAAKKKLSIAEIPIHYMRRKGQSKVRIWDGFRIMGNLLRERMSP